MANRWGNNRNNDRPYFLGLKITADVDCSHEIKRRLFLGRKVMTNLDSIQVVIYRYDSWTIKKAEHRSDASELWCWRRLFSVSWTARRSNQSILKEISPEFSMEGLMLKVKLQSFGHLMLGKIEGGRSRG